MHMCVGSFFKTATIHIDTAASRHIDSHSYPPMTPPQCVGRQVKLDWSKMETRRKAPCLAPQEEMAVGAEPTNSERKWAASGRVATRCRRSEATGVPPQPATSFSKANTPNHLHLLLAHKINFSSIYILPFRALFSFAPLRTPPSLIPVGPV